MTAGMPSLTAAQKVKVAVKRSIGLSGIRTVNILAGPARGVAMSLDFSGDTPMYVGMYEWELHQFFRQVLPSAKLVFDIGGHMGYDAMLFAQASKGTVITFEPSTARAQVLEGNLARNAVLASRISVNTNFVATTDAPGVVTLDTITASHGPPDVIKIDIDGGEADALRGGLRTLRERRPHVVVETHTYELERECGALLGECGYAPIIKHNRKIWREHRAGAPHNRWLLAHGRPRSA